MTQEDALNELQDDINRLRGKGLQVGTLNDGYHSFNELYAHRIANFIALAKKMAKSTFKPVWISDVQSDGTAVAEGWFLLGIGKRAGQQITYHIPSAEWDTCKAFADVLKKAPEYDGHTSADVLTRIAEL